VVHLLVEDQRHSAVAILTSIADFIRAGDNVTADFIRDLADVAVRHGVRLLDIEPSPLGRG
jgi:hypothetical protein